MALAFKRFIILKVSEPLQDISNWVNEVLSMSWCFQGFKPGVIYNAKIVDEGHMWRILLLLC